MRTPQIIAPQRAPRGSLQRESEFEFKCNCPRYREGIS